MREEFSWPPDAIGTLRARWADDVTAQAIADDLGITKCAVCGKARRLGLPKRREGSAGPKRNGDGKVIPSAPPRKPVMETPKKAPPPVQAPKLTTTRPAKCLPGSRMLKLFQLKDGMCRWPIGDPRHSSFRFCGCDCDPTRPYCCIHTRLATA